MTASQEALQNHSQYQAVASPALPPASCVSAQNLKGKGRAGGRQWLPAHRLGGRAGSGVGGAWHREGCSVSCALSRCLPRPGLEEVRGLVLQRDPQVHPAPEDPWPGRSPLLPTVAHGASRTRAQKH